MSQPGITVDSTNQMLKVEVGATGSTPGSAASSGAAQTTNGGLAGGAAGALWGAQGLGTGAGGAGAIVTSSMTLPPLEPVKTRKKGVSVRYIS